MSLLGARCPRSFFGLTSLALVPALSAQNVTFLPRVDFGLAQENAQQCVSGDFDGDGNLDIAVTMEGYNQGKLEVLYGDGQSDFGTSREFVSYVAWGLTKGDFDGDGWPDLATTSYGWAQHGVHLFHNNHDRSFTNNANVSTLASPPVALTVGDLDSDGVLDLAAASESGGYAVDWFHGNGNGSFSSFQVVPNTTNLVGRRVYAGHFNHGPSLDLVLIHQGGAMVLLNDQLGTGYLNATTTGITADTMTCAVVTDLDADGVDDLVVAGANGQGNFFKVWHAMGDGTFVIWGVYPCIGALDIDSGDVTGDGVDDLLIVGYGGAQLWTGVAIGGFQGPQTITTGFYPVAGAIGDWNNDGWNDIAITCRDLSPNSSFVSIYEQTPPAVTATATTYGVGCGSPVLGLAPVAAGRPRLGQVGRATITNVPIGISAIAIGFSDQDIAGVPLPASLAFLGMNGCDLLQSADMMDLAATPAAGGTMAFSIAIPSQTRLLGLDAYLQAYALAPGQNDLGAIVSNGLQWHLGNQ